jgi:hypothetical protein
MAAALTSHHPSGAHEGDCPEPTNLPSSEQENALQRSLRGMWIQFYQLTLLEMGNVMKEAKSNHSESYMTSYTEQANMLCNYRL